MSTGTESAVVPPAGWYPDPADARRQRWWSGATWTEHVEQAPLVESAPVLGPSGWVDAGDAVPVLTRFARDPALRPPDHDDVPIVRQRDPYRDRNVLAGAALVAALISIPGTIADVVFTMPTLVSYLIGGVPISLGVIGLVASFKMGYSTRMAWLALIISSVTMVAGMAITAQQATDTLDIPGITVPGLREITDLENGAGLGN